VKGQKWVGVLRIKVFDVGSTVPVLEFEQPMDSFVIAFIQLLYIQMAFKSCYITNTQGGSVSCSYDYHNFNAPDGSTSKSYGIMVGSNSNPVDVTNSKLGSQFTTGWTYGAMSYSVPFAAGSKASFFATRSIQNQSGGGHFVYEFGIVGDINGIGYGLLVRDVVESGIWVGNGQQITVEYELGVSVPLVE
jgi:hypothetical protein